MHKYEIEEGRRKVASLLGMPKNDTNTQHITKMLDERRQLEQSIRDIHNLKILFR